MEFSTSEGVNVYITGDMDDLSEIEEDDGENMSGLLDSEPTVYITEVSSTMARALIQELNIPSKRMGESEMLLSQLQNDEKGDPVVTIKVPVDGFVSEDDENVETIDLQFSDGILSSEMFSKNSPKSVLINKPEEIFISGGEKYVIKPIPVKIKSRLPIWKRDIPKKPGSISNFLYPHHQRGPRSRLIIDCPTNIPVQEYKAQLADTSDIVTTLDVAPSTKRKIKELMTNSVSKLFAYPGKPYPSKKLYNLYQRHLTSSPQTHTLPDDLDLQPLGYTPSIDYTQIKRIVRKRKPNEANLITRQTNVAPETINLESDSIVQAVVPLNDQVVRVLIKPGVMGEAEQEILVLHDGSDKGMCLEGSSSLQHSIEVLLAAAGESEVNTELQQEEAQVFICGDDDYEGNPFMSEQIIIVQSEYEVDEMCAQTIESA